MLNFLADPLIYGIRMREIRRAYRRLVVALLPCNWCRSRLQTDQQRHAASGMTDFGASFSVVAMTTRANAPSEPMGITESNLLDNELSIRDE